MSNQNPLQKYFRASTTSTRIPSMGKFQDADNISFTSTGEVSVMAMRAADEMLLKSPDALMSGYAIESLLQSCVVNLKDPKQLPSPDVDALMLAIRMATFGNSMELETQCPKCEGLNAYNFDIQFLLDTIKPLEDEYPVRLTDDLIIYVKPFNLKSSTQISTVIFQETRKMQVLETADEVDDDELQRQRNGSYMRLHQINTQMLADSVERIATPEGVVTNRDHINEYINKSSRQVTKLIEEKIKEINKSGLDRDRQVTCSHCKHEWETTIEFDPSSFFEPNS